jgi:agmatinase
MSAARDRPRYTGVRTFAGLRHAPLGGDGAMGAGAAIVGIPFDTATSWRPGARFGPEAIRSASVLLRDWHPVHGVAALGDWAIDAGDVAVTPGNAARSAEQVAAALGPLCAAGAVTIVLGGDHSVSLGELRAHASVRGPLALLLLDAHADTWEDYYGERLFHGTVIRRACEEGLLDPAGCLIAGVRGSLYGPGDLDQARDLGIELLDVEQLRSLSAHEFAAAVRGRVGERPLFVGVDIDVADPSAAPGTGTPEVGGLSSSELIGLLRSLAGVSPVGFDVVEVSPPYDSPGQITSLLAANAAYEMLALTALARAS